MAYVSKQTLLAVTAYLVCAAIALAIGAYSATASTPNSSDWTVDGDVNAITESGGTSYVGGSFTSVSLDTGPGAGFSASTGSPDPDLPEVNGNINAVESDGSGGWYIGGAFTQVGGIARNRIAHIKSNGSVDSSWNPNANSTVRALEVVGSNVFAAGSFTSIGGLTRKYLAKLSTITGTADATWNPNLNGAAYSLEVDGTSYIYVGGSFTKVQSSTRNRAAKISQSGTGNAQGFNPNVADGTVYAIALNGSSLIYVGGSFTQIYNKSRSRIAYLSTNTGAPYTWDPGANGTVRALEFYNSYLYVGGDFNGFNSFGGKSRDYIASIWTGTATASNWNPDADARVRTLDIYSSTIYAGGDFTTVRSLAHNRLVALDTNVNNYTPTSWSPSVDNNVYALAATSSTVYAGGTFQSASETRNRVAAFDSSGDLTSWNPDANGTVRALDVDSGNVYTGGDFTSIGGSSRDRLAALSTADGSAATWDPGANGTVRTLEVSGSYIYVGGDFTTVRSSPRNQIASIWPGVGNVTTWNPNANGNVHALDVDGSTVYLGGEFTSVGGQLRNRIAALSTATGKADATWNPNAGNTVRALTVLNSTVYAGGSFTTIGGQTRPYIAALNPTGNSGTATSWNPSANTSINALAASGSTVYAGGDFSSFGGELRNRAGAVDISTGLANGWDPNASGGNVYALAISGSTVYVGGSFTSLGGVSTGSYGTFTFPTNTALPAITGTPHVGQLLSCSQGTWTGSPSGYTYLWKRGGSAISGATSSTYTLGNADAGNEITCTVTATNTGGPASATSIAVDAIDVPANTALPAISGTPHVGQQLSCSQGTWSGGSISYTYQWKRGGSSISGATSSTYTLVGADADNSITCTVTATNGAGSASATSNGVNAIGVPSNTALPAITGTPHVGQQLSCSNGSWDNTPLSYTYQWKRGGSSIPGATSSTYTLVGADADNSITCMVRAINDAGSDLATSSSVNAIGIPSNTALPAITGTPHVGQQLSCSKGSWDNTPTGYTYLWKRGGSSISGATSSTYTLVGADADNSITCKVGATNAAGSNSVTSSGVNAVGIPSNTALPAITGTPHVGQELSCSNGTWDNTPLSYTYLWKRGGSSISGATSSTYTLVAADADNAITCRVTATNAAGSDSATSSGVNAIGEPENTGAPKVSGTPTVGQRFTCSRGSWNYSPTSYSYTWLRDGKPIPGATDSYRWLTSDDAGRAIKCRVTARNDAGSETSTSAAVNVPAPSSPEAPSRDTTAPVTTIVSGPAAAVRNISAIFTFSANEAGVGFECRVDERTWGACSSPQVVYGLKVGSHTFQVRAQDWAGNTGETASWSWTVDRKAPKLKDSNIKKKKKSKRKGRRIRKEGLAFISGLVGDDVDVKRVKVKLKIVNPRKKSKKGMCASLSLKTGRRIVNKCKWGFARVKGTQRWRIAINRKIRMRLKSRDRYCLLVRTLDSAGNQKTYRTYFRVN